MMTSGGEVMGEMMGEGGHALLQKALGDERARSDQHKQNYEQVKTQLAQLQERYGVLEAQYQQALDDALSMQTKAKAGFQQLQKELRDKNADIEDLKLQALTPEKEELLRQKIALEQEQPFAEKLCAVELEAEKFRNDYNGLRYQHALVQSEFESEQKKAERTIEELKLKFDAECNRLQRERDDAIARCSKATETEVESKRHLSKENFKLQNRVKCFMEEVAEEKSKREEIVNKLESANKKLTTQIAELKTKVRSADSEKASLTQQLKIANDKSESLTTSNSALHARLMEADKKREIVVGEKEKQERDFKRELNALQIDAVKLKSDHAREKDELKNRVVVLECDVETQKERVAKKVEEVLEKEREGEKRVAEVREGEWKEKQKKEEEKAALEKRVAEAEKRVKDISEKMESEKEKYEEEKLKLREEKRDLEREVEGCRRRVNEFDRKEEESQKTGKKLESLKEDFDSLRKENAELKVHLERSEMENEKLAGNVENYSRQLQVVDAELREFKSQTEKYATRMKRDHEAALKLAKEKYERVLKANHDIKKTADNNRAVYQRQRDKYLKVIRHFKKSDALIKAEMEELRALNENLGKNVPAETHYALKKKLKEMMKRHAEFQSLLLYAAPDAAGALAGGGSSVCAPAVGSTLAYDYGTRSSHPRLGDEFNDDDDDDADDFRRRPPPRSSVPPLRAVSTPEPILRNSSQNPILPERKTKSAMISTTTPTANFAKPRSTIADSRSLNELREVKERAEKLQQIQEGQEKEIEKHLEIVNSASSCSPEMLVVNKSGADVIEKESPSGGERLSVAVTTPDAVPTMSAVLAAAAAVPSSPPSVPSVVSVKDNSVAASIESYSSDSFSDDKENF